MMLLIQNSVICFLTVIFCWQWTWGVGLQDYWDEDYNKEKNCASEDLISDREQIDTKKHCVENTIEDPSQSIEDCKRKLTQEVLRPCMGNTDDVPKTGDLLYCHRISLTTCCIHNYTCNGYPETNKKLHLVAEEYMTNKALFLAKEVKKRGFASCYPIGSGLDASKCAKECKSLLKTSPLRDHCNKKNGLLKCCVRRDKVACHECRYCCTLPFCTYKDAYGEAIVEGEDILTTTKIADQDIGTQAVYQLRATNSFYKGYDNRCLKPDDDKRPEKWDHYDPDDFYEASTKEELEQAKTWKFDKNFFNFEDPKVLKKFTNRRSMKTWRKTYGFDHVVIKPNGDLKLYPETIAACVKKETYSTFAKRCRKDKGFFKCCNTVFTLSVFEKLTQHLYNKSLIKRNHEGPTHVAAVVTYSCVVMDEYTGEYVTRYDRPERNPIGGDLSNSKKRIGFRNMLCLSLNLCLRRYAYFGMDLYNYNTRQEYCKAENTVLMARNTNDRVVNEPIGIIESEEDCMKRKSVVRICPQEILKAVHNETAYELSNAVRDAKKKMIIEKKEKRKRKNRKKKKKRRKSRKNKKRNKRGKSKRGTKKKAKNQSKWNEKG